ncbi:MAG: ATP-dependent helicase, partial [Bdellovibrionota bacterium]
MALQLHHLNPNQREAVLHREGPLLVLAGAGSGKTNTMAHRIAHLVADRKLPANNILGLSFTNKAATELKERVTKLIEKSSGKGASKGLVVTTFHSLCARLLRAHAECLGFQKNFTIVDQNDQLDILKQTLKSIHIDDRKFDTQVILFEIGQAKNRFLNREQAEAYFLDAGKLSGDYAIAAASSYGRYQEQLKLLNAMDFDDLLFNAVKLFSEHADLRTYYSTKFRQILVGEYQDTNPAQFKLLRLLTETHQNICVVGDDDQSIYGWRGADAAHILQFSHHFPAARTITLDQNYRSTSTILDAANHVIAKNSNRHPKKLWSDRGVGEPLTEVVLEEDRNESEFVAEEILERAKSQNRPWKDFAVLYRSNAQSRLFEEALRRNQIPYKIVGGMSFLDRKEVKDVLSYWRLIVNPKDDASLRRILNWPSRGIGKSSIEALGNHAFEQKLPFFEVLPEASRLAPRSYAGAMAFRTLILDLRAKLEACAPTPEA